MVAVGDDHGARASAAGHVNDAPPLARLADEALDRRGFGADQRDHAVCRHHVAEAYIDEFHFCFLFIYSIPKPATGYSMF